MPHGHLTPLGRQLRTVLANLSICHQPQARHRSSRIGHGIRDFHNSSPGPSEQKALPQEDQRSGGVERGERHDHHAQATRDAIEPTQHRWARLTAHLRTDHLNKAAQQVGHNIAQHPRSEHDWSMSNLGYQEVLEDAVVRQDTSISLQGILAKYIRDEKGERDPIRARWEPTYTPTASETKFLNSIGYTSQDVDAWSDLVLATDTTEAAAHLADRMIRKRDEPLFVLLHFLGREFMSAHALRTAIRYISVLLERREERDRRENPTLFVVVIRLIRHAREVWPQSLGSIVAVYLNHLQQQDQNPKIKSPGQEQLQLATFALNKIMSLVSLSTAVMPFKDNVHQEMAIIPVLQYMDAHNPPLQITRSGYRAVIRIQLAQKKTPDEQQWSELKALSWPPWKVDRTAMDASIGLEYGISRARATLISMRSAGYAPLAWEKAAELYSGWDPDGTPTVQRRVMLGTGRSDREVIASVDEAPADLRQVLSGTSSSKGRSYNSAYWTARVDSTRTLQEAWACFLAWEDAKLPQDQNVYLTILQKLQEEANNRRDDSQTGQNPSWDLLPGDTPRLSPLPPSTHLYTYTRTAPPKPEDFYQKLRDQGVQFTGHCLAFLLRTSSLQTGLARMKDSLSQYPELEGVLTMDPNHDLNNLPSVIFTAAIQLLARSGGYFLHDREWNHPDSFLKQLELPISSESDQHLDAFYQNQNSVIMRAIELLRRRPNCPRHAWVAVFVGLTRESNFPGLGQALGDMSVLIDPDPPEEVRHLGALLAYGTTRRLVGMYRENFSDLDSMAFYRLCLVTEAMARSVWEVDLLRDEHGGQARRVKDLVRKWDYDGRFVTSGLAGKELRDEFKSLVGNVEDDDAEVVLLGGAKLPRLLFIPNPAMLHVYIRALGWLGDFEGLREAVRWMREFREEVGERKERDRLGGDMFRRAIVALRVFLERTWRIERAIDRGEGVLDTRLGTPADGDLVDEIRDVVESVEEWEGWATDEEVKAYADDHRFDGLRGE